MGFRDEETFAPEACAGIGGVLGRLSAATGQAGNRTNPDVTEPGVYAPETYGSPTGDLISRIRDLQQQQAGYRPNAARSRLTDQIVGAEALARTATNIHFPF